MKILNPSRSGHGSNTGFTVVVVLILIAIVLIYLGANLRSLHQLNREIKLIERRQVQRLKAQATNVVANPKPQPPTAVAPP